jgi:ATP-dependent helicase Lhr and Lhr-like helicase
MPNSKTKLPKKFPTPLKRVNDYFSEIGWQPFRFQRSVWRAYSEGCSGLVFSATGTGKTLAVWMGPIIEWLKTNPDPSSWNPKSPPPLRVLWITPLRALAGDTLSALQAPVTALNLPWQVEMRTGDSKASAKAKQLNRLPTALVTTPESLSLMLTHEKLLPSLTNIECVIVDEWHELLGTKRGVQTELALARLRKLNPKLRTWGLSATLGNLQQACDVLVGTNTANDVRLIRGSESKKIKLESLIPKKVDKFPWSGHIGTNMVRPVVEQIDQTKSALIFTNTRSQTEIWYQHLLKVRPDWAGRIALHHGSLDTSVRNWVEDGLRDGKLLAVVCTSSLDLGVDFTAVDRVIQVGSPKGVARLLQRAGRSGHQPSAPSHLTFVPTNALELIEFAAAQQAIRLGHLESRLLLERPLDVLAQHAVTVAIGGGFRSEELLEEVRTTASYRNLTNIEWQWVLDFIVRGGSSLNAYPDFHRVECQDDFYRVTQRKVITMHRMNIGTIVSDASMSVRYLKGATLGTIEEYFLSRLEKGERFLFAGRLVELVMIRDNVAYVKRAKGEPDSIPRWMGGRMPLSSELSQAIRLQLQQAAEGILVGREMKALKPLFEIQERWSVIPRADEFLIERIETKTGHQVFLFPFEGRLVHEGMAALLAYRMSRIQKTTLTMACNDYGIVLQSPTDIPLDAAITAGLFSSKNLIDDIFSCMNATEMAKRQFRQIARVAGLIQPGYPGQRKSASHIQASSNLFFDVFCEYDPGNLLLEQSRREVLEQQLEVSRMKVALDRIQQSRLTIMRPPHVTPLSFPLLVDKLREKVSSETLADRVARMQSMLEKSAEQND